MSDLEVTGGKRTLSIVDGNLRARDALVECDSPDGILKVSGNTSCRGDCTFACTLETQGLEGRGTITLQGLKVAGAVEVRRGDLIVRGAAAAEKIEVEKRMTVSGDLTCSQVEVGGALESQGRLKAGRVDIGGSLLTESAEIESADVGGKVSFRSSMKVQRISVGGKLEGDGDLEADRVDVGGTVRVEGRGIIREMDVGGTVVLGGGDIKEGIDVGGTFESTGPLTFRSIDVGGKVSLAGGEGEEIDVGGTLASTGDLSVRDTDVGGKVEVKGNMKGDEIDVGGFLGVSGNLEMTGRVRVGGRIKIGEVAKALSVRVGGEIAARSVEADQDIETHTLLTESGARAQRIEIGKNGQARGPLIGEIVRVGQKADVEDIYARSISLERGSTARNLYGERIDVESRVVVSGEVLYTGDLRAEKDVSFTRSPQKVQELPRPPG